MTVDSEALAFALQPWLQDVNRTTFLQVVERVFDEFSTPGQHLRIASLSIDLGTIPIADFEWVVVERLERELREALQKAIGNPELQASGESLTQPSHDAQLELVERYLLTGTLPFWASPGTFSLEESIADLAATNPDGLARLFRHRGANTRLRRRITHQLSDEALRRLRPLLAPDDAARVLVRDEPDDAERSVITETFVRELYRTDPQGFVALLRQRGQRHSVDWYLLQLDQTALEDLVRRLDPEHADQIAADVAEFGRIPLLSRRSNVLQARRLFWLIAVDVQLSDAGRPYDREAFVRSMVAGIAESEGRTVDDVRAAIGGDGTPRSEAEPARTAVAPTVIFSRYDRVEALEYFIRHGVLPWSVSLREPELTVADALGVLPGLPISLLRTLFQDLRPDERLLAWRRVAGEMSEEALEGLIAAVLAHTDRSAAAMWAQLSARADHASDKALVFAQFIVGLLDTPLPSPLRENDPLPVMRGDPAEEQDVGIGISDPLFASEPGSTLASAETSRWEAHRIKSVLGSRARSATGSGAREPSSTSLLMMVIEEDVEGARHFFRALKDAGIQPSSLVDNAPSPGALDTARTLLAPEAASSVTLLLGILSALPRPDRPGADERVRAVILGEVLDHDTGEFGAPFFARVLRRLFGASIDQDTYDLLMTAADRLAQSGEFPAAQVQNVTAALLRMRTHGAGDELSKELAPGALDTARTLLAPEAASNVTFLLGMLSALPGPDRPGAGDRVRAVILGEALDHDTGEFGPPFFASVLRRLLGPSIAQGTYDLLMTAADRLAQSGECPAAQVQNVTAAILRMRTQGAGGEPSKETAGDMALSHDESIALEWLRRLDAAPDVRLPLRLPHDALRHALVGAIDSTPERVHSVVVERVRDPETRQRWVAVLSESALVRLAYVLEPRRHRVLLDAAELLFSSWLLVAPDRGPVLARRSAFWSFFLEFLSGTHSPERSVERLAGSFFAAVGARERNESSRSPDHRTETGEALVGTAEKLAAKAGQTRLRTILGRDRAALLALWRADTPAPATPSAAGFHEVSPFGLSDSPRRVGRVRERTAFSMDEDERDIGAEPIYIANAGLILTGPFLPRLFQSLDMLERTEDGKGRLIADQISRAVHLLQWLVDGRTSAPEPLLCLNKILCGVPLPTPIERAIELTPRELEICTALLTSMIAHWTIISTTSVQGLQETFLQREGRLQRTSDGWGLFVPRKAVDVLLDQIPWSMSTIVHAWMPEPIFVTW